MADTDPTAPAGARDTLDCSRCPGQMTTRGPKALFDENALTMTNIVRQKGLEVEVYACDNCGKVELFLW